MKKLLYIFSLILITAQLFSQEERQAYKTVAKQFEEHYNSGSYDQIFKMFSGQMKAAVTADQIDDFLSNLKAEAGKIKTRKFARYENTLAVYETTFENGTYAVNISIDNNQMINGFSVTLFEDSANLPQMERNTTALILPFNGEWTVFWGGDTEEQNYHVVSKAQKHAFDLVITDDTGKSYKTDGRTNEDYYAFGKELIAPSDAEVVLAVDGIKDNLPGQMNPVYVPGNTIILKTQNNEYLFFAHFKQNSIRVKQGQKIKKGDVLGLTGNSGNSSEPHLHFHIQNVEDMNKATGVKCFFNRIVVNGETKTDYSPVRGEKIKNN